MAVSYFKTESTCLQSLSILCNMNITVRLHSTHDVGQAVQCFNQLLRAGDQRIHNHDLAVAEDAAGLRAVGALSCKALLQSKH